MEVEAVEARCSQCGTPVVEIHLAGGPSNMTMRSCSTCDHRSWYRHGIEVPLEGVLDTLGTRPRTVATAGVS